MDKGVRKLLLSLLIEIPTWVFYILYQSLEGLAHLIERWQKLIPLFRFPY